MANIDLLNSFQKTILNECLEKKSGGLSLPMGSGKTLLSLVLSLQQTERTEKPILIVVSKTLVSSWIDEIHKFFGESLRYELLHQDFMKGENEFELWRMGENVRIVLTTPNIISKYYKKCNIESKFVKHTIINQGYFNQHTIIEYVRPSRPFSTINQGPGLIYGIEWGCLIVDEIQKFTNASTQQCRGLAAVCADRRWGLSGTMFDEPKPERILGYHLIINDADFPRNLPACERYIRSWSFRGIQHTVVQRKHNDAFMNPPSLNEVIINHTLTAHEQKVYLSMKETLRNLSIEVKKYKANNDAFNIRRFNSYMMAMITYLRQSIVCPLLPIANVALDVTDYNEKSILSEMLLGVIRKMNIDDWLDDPESVLSSRLRSVLEIINKHEGERIVVFTSFRTCLDVLKAYLPKNRDVFVLTAAMSIKSRGITLESFNKSENGILLMTYDLGAEGLNIQSSHTALLIDLWWNSAKTQQAICRVFRFGQSASVVNVYYFTSNTGIEKALLDKHVDKLTVLDELKIGPLKSTVKSIDVQKIITLLEKEKNIGTMQILNQRLHE